jgi:hypothetical protein
MDSKIDDAERMIRVSGVPHLHCVVQFEHVHLRLYHDSNVSRKDIEKKMGFHMPFKG